MGNREDYDEFKKTINHTIELPNMLSEDDRDAYTGTKINGNPSFNTQTSEEFFDASNNLNAKQPYVSTKKLSRNKK